MLSLGDYGCMPATPSTTFFSPRLLADGLPQGRPPCRPAGKCDIIIDREQKHTQLTFGWSAVQSPHFIFQRPNSREERPVASKAKRPLHARLSSPPPAKANSPGHAAAVAAKVGRCPQKTVFELCDGGQPWCSSLPLE